MIVIKLLPILSLHLTCVVQAFGLHGLIDPNQISTSRRSESDNQPYRGNKRRSAVEVDCSNKITYEDGNTYCLYKSGDKNECTGGMLTVGSLTYCSTDACATDCDDSVGCFDDSGCLVANNGETYCEWDNNNSPDRVYEYKYECSSGAVYKYSRYEDIYDRYAGPGWTDWTQGDEITSTSEL